MAKRSPLAPKGFPHMPRIAGVRVAGLAAGLKPDGSHDLFMAELAPGSTVAGTLTRSGFPGAPVEWTRKHLPRGKVRAIVANSGNSNVFTGRAGPAQVEATAAAAAKLLGCPRSQVLLASTGRIGVKRAPDFVAAKLPRAKRKLKAGAWHDAARAIMTTDSFPKAARRTALIGGTRVTLAGIAKGCTMIAPDMGTMLSFLFTDAKISAKVLRAALRRAVDLSFNSISVDGDTSTSDTVLLAATGKGARHKRIASAGDPEFGDFRRALEELTRDLALQIVRDGENPRRLIAFHITGAESARAARRIGRVLATSTLTRRSIAERGDGWGRLVAAVGRAGEKADRDRLSIRIGGTAVAEAGEHHLDYDFGAVDRHLRGREIEIAVDVGVGRGRARVWTSM
ncbi:MAG: bifunctional glutamate N-acetyltransferase/amino-acid acetyltransferase ArgJ [Alphaproteobacteria bacterium]|jgi:glutamate N-acetyltransferase/amino-acid N-acetyltransferase|nr:bifunctional glutamate N-acetyltransferase/amino-acid acetyltransferase ArgJ [Alphaproteobacteria bacterium]